MGCNRLPLAVSPDERVRENYGSRKGLAFKIPNLRRIARYDGGITVGVDSHARKGYRRQIQTRHLHDGPNFMGESLESFVYAKAWPGRNV
jgi:hypothetical protein